MAALTDSRTQAARRDASPLFRDFARNVAAGIPLAMTAGLLATRAAVAAVSAPADNFTRDAAEARDVMAQPGGLGSVAAERVTREGAITTTTLWNTMQDIAGRSPRGVDRAQDFTPEQNLGRNRLGRGR
ncbi:MAG: hypothetical protein ACOYNI_11035 [Acidimicrobiia bacterium]